MTDAFDPTTQITLNDIAIGARLVEALLHHVKKNGAAPIGYAELLELGRFLDPKDAEMGRAEVLGMAMKLRFVSEFCKENGYPDLASLAAHPLPGADADRDAERRAAAAFDWTAAPEQLAAYIKAAKARVPARLKPRKERPAEVSWYAYFSAHREACKNITSSDKKEVVNLMMAGLDPETALRRFLAAKAEFGPAAPL